MATLVEKLISKRLGAKVVKVGEIVPLPVDKLLINDYVGDIVFSALGDLGCKEIRNPHNIFLNIDHNLPSFTVDAADKMVRFNERAKQFGLKRNTKFGNHGIGHQLMIEDFVKPYDIALGTDSHATMYGGVGAFSCGITASDAVSIMTTGELWIKVPHTLRINVQGKIPLGVTSKDIALRLLGVFKPEEYIYAAVEITGEAIDNMSVDGRLVIANMIAETGAKCAVFEADEKAFEFTGTAHKTRLASDADAVFSGVADIDISQMEPMLSFPDKVTNVEPLANAAGKHVDQVFIGSCTNGRYEDLVQAAQILKGRKVNEGTRLIVTPASQQVAIKAVKAGVMEILMDAGAMILTSSCASCAGHGPGLIGKGECCLSTTNRNFKGRMGSKEAGVFLGSAYAAAASAVTGVITDPRIFLAKEAHQ